MSTTSTTDAARQAAQPGIFNKVTDSVVEKILSHAGTQTVFGDPVREGDRTVIPVAHVTYRFGFGAGEGPSKSSGESPAGGGGGGGGSRFVPITDTSHIVKTVARPSLSGQSSSPGASDRVPAASNERGIVERASRDAILTRIELNRFRPERVAPYDRDRTFLAPRP